MPRVLSLQEIHVEGWNAPLGGPGERVLTQLPDELLALVLQFLDMRSRYARSNAGQAVKRRHTDQLPSS